MTAGEHWFSTDRVLVYAAFCADFGPMNLAAGLLAMFYFFVFVNVMFCGTHMGLAAGLGCALFLFFCSRRLWAHGSGRWSPFAALSFLCDGDTLGLLSFFYQRQTQERTCCSKFVPECGDFRSNSPPTNLLSNSRSHYRI